MNNQTLNISTNLQIQKDRHEIFEAIVDPEKMKHYFIASSTGRMEEGKELLWKFPEFDTDVPVRVHKIEMDKYISYYWDSDGHDMLVEINFIDGINNSTIVKVTEKSRDNDEAGIKWLKGNTEGWANFLACLKAWLEYGINLRKGGYDFMRKP